MLFDFLGEVEENWSLLLDISAWILIQGLGKGHCGALYNIVIELELTQHLHNLYSRC